MRIQPTLSGREKKSVLLKTTNKLRSPLKQAFTLLLILVCGCKGAQKSCRSAAGVAKDRGAFQTAAKESHAEGSDSTTDTSQGGSLNQIQPVHFQGDAQPITSDPANTSVAKEAAASQVKPEEVAAPQGKPADPASGKKDDDAAKDKDEDASKGANQASRTKRLAEPDSEPAQRKGNPVELEAVIASVYAYFPLLDVANLERDVASGNQLSAWGAFDTKVKATSDNEPIGFYENYRHSVGVSQPTYRGGEVFGGYRIGRGEFEPWYLERETNKGGEFKAGFMMPLARNREIDARRAELWRATFDMQRVEPEIRSQLIGFVLDASVAYWVWVAAGKQYEIGERALRLAVDRNQGLTRRVEKGDLDPPVLKDNERAIAEREAKLFARQQKLDHAAIKLSLFLRSMDASPIVPQREQLPEFDEAIPIPPEQLASDIATAIANRPETQALDALARRTRVDLAEGFNDLRPNVDAGVAASQDTGEPTSTKEDKSPFELEVGLAVDMPIQRRKGLGKIRASQAKLSQIEAKREFTVNKISVEVQNAYVSLVNSYEQLQRTEEAVELAEELAKIERRKFELGESDLLSVFLREQFAIEAAETVVMAMLDYHIARSEYMAAMAYEYPVEILP